MVKHINYYNAFLLLSLLSTLLASFFLSSSLVSANDDSVIDDINITVPSACTMIGTGMNSHNATINNGTYATDIGTTTIKAFCNDSDGFAIYAIGYTDDTDGKNVMTSDLGADYNIQTGTGTSGNSQWAMKLATDSNATYPITIQNNYDSYHTVPDDFELVAKRTSFTDIGQNAVGTSLTSTYQVFIANNQPAGTYVGQVKYVMVHPNNTDEIPVREDQIGVIFDGNGLTFPGGAKRNRVVYGESCSQMYIRTTPEIVKTSNVSSDGTKQTAYEPEEHILQTKTFNGADKVRVVLRYGLTDEAYITLVEGDWPGWDEEDPSGVFYDLKTWDSPDSDYMLSGTKTYTFDSDAVTIEMNSWNTPESGYDYGMFAEIYPIYSTEQTGTEEASICEISSTPVSGAYAETTIWKGKWYTTINNELVWFENQSAIFSYVSKNSSDLLGSTLKYYAYYPFTIYYDGNNATAGTMNGYFDAVDFISDAITLTAPNYYKTNYGFIGWSEDSNATPNSSVKIYGPNETVSGNELSFNSENHDTTLYAIWVPSTGSLQDWNGCSGLSDGQVTALTDSRDNNTYAVAKLADGNCWMIENLRLDAANSSDSSKAQGFGGVFTGLATSEPFTSFYSNNTNSNSKYSTSIITGSDSSRRIPRYNNSNTNPLATNTISSKNDNIYSYGNYYSWSAAAANTTGNAPEAANTSICPKGWILPYSGENGKGNNPGGFYYLLNAISSFNIRTYPNNFVRSGYLYDRGNSNYRGVRGLYWSTSGSSTLPYNLTVDEYNGGNASHLSWSDAYRGMTVRCVLVQD